MAESIAVTHDTETPPSSASTWEASTLEISGGPDAGPWGLEVGSPHGCHIQALERGDRLVIGTGRDVDLRVEDRTVSARHARIEATSEGVIVVDLGSRNGVYVGGARVESALVAAGETSLVVGRTAITVRSMQQVENVTKSGDPIPGLIGSSAPMRRLCTEVRKVAALRGPVLLQGESGSGKDVVARCIHSLSKRVGAYVPLNVGAIPESLADTELFGHCRGAFTGAVSARTGAFEQAHRGTLFLDEIADLPPSIQVKILRVVEDRRVRPVGGIQLADVDVRIVSATWAPLDERVAAGSFREDLYHRIATFVIRVPPLRTRKSDIPALSRAMLRRLSDEVGPKELTPQALAALVQHPWPGNVRELGSVLYRAAASAPTEEIDVGHVVAALAAPGKNRARALESEEARVLLEEHSGNVSASARAAGVPRSTFRSWLARDQKRPTTEAPADLGSKDGTTTT